MPEWDVLVWVCIFFFSAVLQTGLWCFIMHWDWEILSWGIRDQTFSSCQGDAVKQMLGKRQRLLAGAGGAQSQVLEKCWVTGGGLHPPAHGWGGGSSTALHAITSPCLRHRSCYREKLWNSKHKQARKPRGKSLGRKRPCFLWCVIPVTSLSYTAYWTFSFCITF